MEPLSFPVPGTVQGFYESIFVWNDNDVGPYKVQCGGTGNSPRRVLGTFDCIDTYTCE